MVAIVTPETSQSRLDLTFLARHFSERESRFPIDSDFYARLAAHFAHAQKGQREKWAADLPRALPAPIIEYYNAQFARTAEVAARRLECSSLPAATKQRAGEVLGYRLGPQATFADLLASDAFHTLTWSLEYKAERSFGEVSSIPATHGLDVSHLFLHRVQQTEFLFFHEMAVGYLCNEMQPERPRIKNRSELGLSVSIDYFALSAYTLKLIAAIMGRPADEVANLHFADSTQLRAEVPGAVLDLMTLASHIYWYFDYLNAVMRVGYDASAVLNFGLLFFVIPGLEHVQAHPDQRVDPESGRHIDRAFSSFDLAKGTPTQMDLARILLRLVDTTFIVD